MKRRITMLLVTALAAASIAGCGAKGTTDTTVTEGQDTAVSETNDHLARIKAAGKITIATEGVWAPFTYHDPDTNELVGFDVEVAAAIADVRVQETVGIVAIERPHLAKRHRSTQFRPAGAGV